MSFTENGVEELCRATSSISQRKLASSSGLVMKSQRGALRNGVRKNAILKSHVLHQKPFKVSKYLQKIV